MSNNTEQIRHIRSGALARASFLVFALAVCLVALIEDAVAGEIGWVIVMAFCIALNGFLLSTTIAPLRRTVRTDRWRTL